MGNASGVSGGDRNRNARLARLRALVPTQNAIVGVDLAPMGRLAEPEWGRRGDQLLDQQVLLRLLAAVERDPASRRG
jgi:hypothetical protein